MFDYEGLGPPLKGTSIRLLTVAPGNANDILHCSLRVVDLDARPTYTAISYSWEKGQDAGESWSGLASDLRKQISWESFKNSRDFWRSGGKIPILKSFLMDGGMDRKEEYMSVLKV